MRSASDNRDMRRKFLRRQKTGREDWFHEKEGTVGESGINKNYGIITGASNVCKKDSLYIAQYPVRWTTQGASHFLHSVADLFIPTPTRLLREAF